MNNRDLASRVVDDLTELINRGNVDLVPACALAQKFLKEVDHLRSMVRAVESSVCYMGHEDCYDMHTSERLADEADWEADRQREMEEWADDFLRRTDGPGWPD